MLTPPSIYTRQVHTMAYLPDSTAAAEDHPPPPPSSAHTQSGEHPKLPPKGMTFPLLVRRGDIENRRTLETPEERKTREAKEKKRQEDEAQIKFVPHVGPYTTNPHSHTEAAPRGEEGGRKYA